MFENNGFKIYSDFRESIESQFLIELVDYDLCITPDGEYVRFYHENVRSWQDKDEPKVFDFLSDKNKETLEWLIAEWERVDADDDATTDDVAEIQNQIEEILG